MSKSAKVLAVVNQKGGVGKSTTAVNLSAALGEAGKEVLLIDLDPQGNATSGFGLSKEGRELCIYDALLPEDPANPPSFADMIERHSVYPVDVVPATIQLAGAEVELVSAMSRETRLKSLVDPERDKYDYIIIDCAPSLGLLTINALTAADGVLVPIQCEFYSLEGLSKLLDSVRLVNTHLNSSLEVFGVVMTMHDGRTKLAQQVVDEVREFFGETAFETLIPRSVRISEAPSHGESVLEYDSRGKGAAAYRNLAKEVMSRG
ncbi:MAG: AAA family ATPase [Coriobacteriia bacterium]|nr:AAA family ATPase [Coriobacteriia bacterium]MCL2537131.1 AAA family ATPase [Coriobacteriia bacterium]